MTKRKTFKEQIDDLKKQLFLAKLSENKIKEVSQNVFYNELFHGHFDILKTEIQSCLSFMSSLNFNTHSLDENGFVAMIIGILKGKADGLNVMNSLDKKMNPDDVIISTEFPLIPVKSNYVRTRIHTPEIDGKIAVRYCDIVISAWFNKKPMVIIFECKYIKLRAFVSDWDKNVKKKDKSSRSYINQQLEKYSQINDYTKDLIRKKLKECNIQLSDYYIPMMKSVSNYDVISEEKPVIVAGAIVGFAKSVIIQEINK